MNYKKEEKQTINSNVTTEKWYECKDCHEIGWTDSNKIPKCPKCKKPMSLVIPMFNNGKGGEAK